MMWLNIFYSISQYTLVLSLWKYWRFWGLPKVRMGIRQNIFSTCSGVPRKNLASCYCVAYKYFPHLLLLWWFCVYGRSMSYFNRLLLIRWFWMLIKKSHNGFPIRLIVMCGFLWPSSKLGSKMSNRWRKRMLCYNNLRDAQEGMNG